MTVGSALGSFFPMLWGASELSFLSIIFGVIGGIVGILVGFKLSS